LNEADRDKQTSKARQIERLENENEQHPAGVKRRRSGESSHFPINLAQHFSFGLKIC
jgi:hypothetical protein